MMPRQKGSLNVRTQSLIRAVANAEGASLAERLSSMVDDGALPLRMRLDCCRLLAGALSARVRLHDAAQEAITRDIAA
jgi:hypothetical protein